MISKLICFENKVLYEFKSFKKTKIIKLYFYQFSNFYTIFIFIYNRYIMTLFV